MVRAIGADQVIDYTQEDFVQSGERYDILLDCIGNHSLPECRRVLNTRGIHVPIGGKGDRLFGPLIKKLALSPFTTQKFALFFLAKPNKADLAILCDLTKTGKVTPVIDRCYHLSEIAEAMRHLEGGHARGKIVISLEQGASRTPLL